MDVVLGIASRREDFKRSKGEGFRGGEGQKSHQVGRLADDGKRNEMEMDVVYLGCFSERKREGVWGRGGLNVAAERRLADDGKRLDLCRSALNVAMSIKLSTKGRGLGRGGAIIGPRPGAGG